MPYWAKQRDKTRSRIFSAETSHEYCKTWNFCWIYISQFYCFEISIHLIFTILDLFPIAKTVVERSRARNFRLHLTFMNFAHSANSQKIRCTWKFLNSVFNRKTLSKDQKSGKLNATKFQKDKTTKMRYSKNFMFHSNFREFAEFAKIRDTRKFPVLQ